MTYFYVVIEIGKYFQIDISPMSKQVGALKINCGYGGQESWLLQKRQNFIFFLCPSMCF